MTHQIQLSGLDGSNPLAFLAALGTLRSLTSAFPDSGVRMSWTATGAWRPVLHTNQPTSEDQLIEELDRQLRSGNGSAALEIGDDLKLTPADFRAAALRACHSATPQDRSCADLLAGFSCDAVYDNELVQDTALRTMSGAGHQHFLKFMRVLVSETDVNHLRKALFAPWQYDDPGPSLRWDPRDDRRYALRWDEPSGDPIRTVRGANRVAIEGLALLPTVPVGPGLATTGFQGRGRSETYWSWPIWSMPVSMDVVRSLLASPDIQTEKPDRVGLASMGVVEVYRCQRLTIGKYRNFSPACPA